MVEHTFKSNGDKDSTIEIYRSSSTEPQFITDEGCKCIGEVSLQLDNIKNRLGKLILVQMVFGGTQIEVKAKEQQSERWSVKASINFLKS